MRGVVHVVPRRDAVTNALMGGELFGPRSANGPVFEIQSAPPRLLRIAVRGSPLMWARLDEDHGGWCWLPNVPLGGLLEPIPARDARRIARLGRGTDAWWLAWMSELAPGFAPLVLGGQATRIDLVPWPAPGTYPLTHEKPIECKQGSSGR